MTAKNAFQAYTKGSGEMDGRTFVKILKDTKVLDGKQVTSVDADLIFAKIKPRGTTKINYSQFEEALKLVAEKKKVSLDKVLSTISEEGQDGPILQGTKADNVRFHDDKSTYTGVHKSGGPTTLDEGRVQFNDLSNFCDRSAYDIRGVKKGIIEQKTGESK
ncbi:p25-alpha family protein [Besnoitia besnoiti]|uniref:p25-alpha family protein n=1 Tax=Besnoitia besnoiti TaxID=94643 RepID=A0A2A9MHH1_BESBE|nr:p25-alpha family protein [Besnoitia besnoiti]PFH35711.1 p25-alpha family protein [Besnoitia besnoiti]